ncbi:hypothetical protein [Candidatus Magnetomonas plexicatena]|uniref:hypothetical protein n=1 Tax=Candidatus Magnetomonas plexicatena TaxID=2552947 RepID=UPI0011054380|nr:hypothetical protein E2O03_004965 [Nitrospirales bacterium LBB_01]
MFKLIKRIIYLAIFSVVGFYVISYVSGGENFRWFGKETERTGKAIKEFSEKAAEKADDVRKSDGFLKGLVIRTYNKIKSIINSKKKAVKEEIKDNTTDDNSTPNKTHKRHPQNPVDEKKHGSNN